MGSSIKPSILAFLLVLAMTAFVWMLRGFGVLTFIPGSVLWVLILLCVGTALISTVR